MLFNIDLGNDLWREHLVNNSDYVAFCATTLTTAAINDSRYLQSEPEAATSERIAFDEKIIEKAAQFAPLYAQITAASIELAETHYASREAFLTYTIQNWAVFFAMGKNIILKA